MLCYLVLWPQDWINTTTTLLPRHMSNSPTFSVFGDQQSPRALASDTTDPKQSIDEWLSLLHHHLTDHRQLSKTQQCWLQHIHMTVIVELLLTEWHGLAKLQQLHRANNYVWVTTTVRGLNPQLACKSLRFSPEMFHQTAQCPHTVRTWKTTTPQSCVMWGVATGVFANQE